MPTSYSEVYLMLYSMIVSTYSYISDTVQVTTGISSSFWVVIDMLSGRYLYQNLKGQTQAKGEELASW